MAENKVLKKFRESLGKYRIEIIDECIAPGTGDCVSISPLEIAKDEVMSLMPRKKGDHSAFRLAIYDELLPVYENEEIDDPVRLKLWLLNVAQDLVKKLPA
jgi:hypothetical protein